VSFCAARFTLETFPLTLKARASRLLASGNRPSRAASPLGRLLPIFCNTKEGTSQLGANLPLNQNGSYKSVAGKTPE